MCQHFRSIVAPLVARKRRLVVTRIKRYENTIYNFTDKQFQENFRVNRTTFNFLLGAISNSLVSKRSAGRQTIDPSKQILAVLWLLATPDSYR